MLVKYIIVIFFKSDHDICHCSKSVYKIWHFCFEFKSLQQNGGIVVSALDYQDSGSVLSIDRIHFFTNQYGSGDTQPHKMSSKYLLEFLVFAWKEFGHCASLCCNIKNVLPWIYLYSKIFPKHCLFNKSFILILLMKDQSWFHVLILLYLM